MNVAPWCQNCGTSMDACGELGDDCWACDELDVPDPSGDRSAASADSDEHRVESCSRTRQR